MRSLVFLLCYCLAYCQYNPFDDSILFEVSWPGKLTTPPLINTQQEPISHLLVTPDNEQYNCYIPSQIENVILDSTMDNEALSPIILLNDVLNSKSCVFLVEGYWSYELCFGLHLRQFHEDRNKDGKVMKLVEYTLGAFNLNRPLSPPSHPPPTWNYLDNEYPYYKIEVGNGSPCDIRGDKRRITQLLFICDPEQGHTPTLVLVKETTTCEYEAVIATKQLCQNKDYQTKEKPTYSIQCHPISESPNKPLKLLDHELSVRELVSSDSVKHVSSPQKSSTSPFSKSNLQSVHQLPQDESFVKSFLSGDTCLIGGFNNWWEHEICFKKLVRQIHRESGIVKQSIIMGVWNEESHKDWYSRAGKSKHSKNHVIHLYDDGDVCDVTGQPRKTRVKFKCIKSKSNNQVSLYMEEPTPCNYLLTIEAGFICELLQSLDDHGMFLID